MKAERDDKLYQYPAANDLNTCKESESTTRQRAKKCYFVHSEQKLEFMWIWSR